MVLSTLSGNLENVKEFAELGGETTQENAQEVTAKNDLREQQNACCQINARIVKT